MTAQHAQHAADQHPLPRRWHWRIEDGHLIAVDESDMADGEAAEVWVLDDNLESNRASIPADVALAVILASKGLDSLGAMAAAAYQQGRSHERIDIVDFITSPPGRIPEWVRGKIAELTAAIGSASHEGWGKRLYDMAVKPSSGRR